MKQNFNQAVRLVIGLEGGYSNDAHDPGLETKFGISKRSHPDLDIKALTMEQAKTIYRAEYWNWMNCDALPKPWDIYAFDCAVNQGPKAAAQTLQSVLGVKMDGIIGNVTVAAAIRAGQEGAAKFMASRAKRYMANINFKRYGDGWLKRLFIVAAN